MKKITRTIQFTEIKACEVCVTGDGEVKLIDLDVIEIAGEVVNWDKGLKIAKKQNPGKQIILKEVNVKEDMYEMSVEDFLNCATIVNKENKE